MFKGNDSAEKSKGIKLPSGWFKYIWFEELTEFDGIDAVETVIRSVVRGDKHSNVFYSYNPPKSANNWVNSECLVSKDNRLVHHSTYLDVPPEWLGKQFIEDAEVARATNELKYNWAYLGAVTGTGGAVFDNVVTREITDDELQTLDKLYDGLDFGFAVDPSVYVICSYNAAKKTLHIIDEYVKVGASFDTIAEEIKKRNAARRPITADSAEPRSIDELRQRDIRVHPAKKGPGSVEHGMKWLQDLNEIIIDPARTPEAAREFLGYEYPLDKDGHFKAQYPDEMNHCLDSTRYALEHIMKQKGGYFVNVDY